ncbi:unnamed protein product [Rhodiola kirilowii]
MSGDGPKGGPDYFGFFTHELEDLLSGENSADDDFLPLLGFKSNEVSKEMRENDVDETRESGGDGDIGLDLEQTGSLFCDGLGGELSDYRKERLNGLLKQSVSVLTQEVDQMVEVVLATCELQHHLRSKSTASSSLGPSKKSKSPKANSEPTEEDYLERPNKFKSMSDILSQNGESCVNCNVAQTSMWRRTPDGSRICNACGLRLRKGNLQLSPTKKDQTIVGSQAEADNKKEVTDDQKFLLDNDRLQNGESCVNCNVAQTSMWRRTPDGSRICNACGLRMRKGDLQLSPQKKDQTIAGSQAEADNKNEEVTDDLKFLLDHDRLQVEQTMKKYADEISSSLGHMEQQLEGFLDNITSKCRNMTFSERQRLWKLIKSLPPKNFDRVVEIIKRGRGLDQHEENDILVDLEDMDDKVLWRLYYYSKAVENAQKLLA